MVRPNMPASPTLIGYENSEILQVDHNQWQAPGMDIRTKIAAMAMQGLLSKEDPHTGQTGHYEFIAELSVRYTDALIKELNKEG